MSKKSLLLLISSFLLLSIFLKLPPLQKFSPQHTVNPEIIAEEISPETTAIYDNQSLSIPSLLDLTPPPSILGNTTSYKRIEVDLTAQRLYAYEGNRQIYNFLISSGKWGRTPTGTFHIWIKLRSSKMEGGSRALNTYYYLPNVPYIMYFYNDAIPKYRGYGLHGTYWHNNFGHPMSHGCINMKTEEVAQLYYWANPDLRGKSSILSSEDNPGTPITIYGEAPWQ